MSKLLDILSVLPHRGTDKSPLLIPHKNALRLQKSATLSKTTQCVITKKKIRTPRVENVFGSEVKRNAFLIFGIGIG